MPSVEGVGARRAALTILDAVLRRAQTVDAAAGHATSKLAANDRALAIAIAGETLRRIPDLDSLIDSATKRPLPDDSKARMVLRIALAQRMALGTPDHAVVATALPLVDGGPRRLVHGVLGTLLRRGLPPLDAPALPAAVEDRWDSAWGAEAVAAARRALARRPALDISFRDAAALERFLAATSAVSLAPLHARLIQSGPVTELPEFGSGSWWVQDLAASLPARLIPPSATDVLDLCAAPGGKTMQLAAAGRHVTSVDSMADRLVRLQENLDRTGLEAALVNANALVWRPERQFDALLLDAPCSATGTFRRHPEILYRATPRFIAEAAEVQKRLLRRAAAWVRPGGILVYAVCSLEPPEGEEIVRDFLNDRKDYRVSPPSDELPGFVDPDGEGFVRILPGMLESDGCLDGFFIARLVRAAQ